MKNLRILSLFCCLLFVYFSHAQDMSIAPENIENLYPDEDYVIVNSERNVTFNFSEGILSAKEEVILDVLCLNEFEGFDFPVFYDGFSSVQGLSYLEDRPPYNGKLKYKRSKPKNITDNAYEDGGLFHQDSRYTLIEARPMYRNTYMQIKYSIEYTDFKYFTSCSFMESVSIPVFKGSLSYYIPDGLNVDLLPYNLETYHTSTSEKVIKEGRLVTYTFEDIQTPDKDWRFLPGKKFYSPHILHVFKSYTSNEGTTVLFENYQYLYNWYNELYKSCGNKSDQLDQIFEELELISLSDTAEIASLYYWVQDNIRYIAFEDGIAGFQPDPAQNVMQKKYGDCKGMANLLAELLKIRGYDARVAWIGTRNSIPYDYTTPNLAVDNHMICALFWKGDTLFLDPTQTMQRFGDLSFRIQGRPVLIENGDNAILTKVPDLGFEKNKAELQAVLSLSEDGKVLNGPIVENYGGDYGNRIQAYFSTLSGAEMEEEIDDFIISDQGMSVSNILYTGLQERSETVSFIYNSSFRGKVIDLGNEKYVNMDVHHFFPNWTREENRTIPYQFDHQIYYEAEVSFQIPDGFTVEYKPEDIDLNADSYSIQLSYTLKGSTMILYKKLIIPDGKIEASEAEKWNDALLLLNETQENQLIIKKL